MPRPESRPPTRGVNRLAGHESLNKAFELAHAIYRFDERWRAIAVRIVTEALQAVDVRLSAQLEADRHDPQKPTKVRWKTEQWFQILVLCKSANYELQQEAGKDIMLSRDDMIIRYLKHMVVTTFRRNSFHVSLGLSRLVYGYSAAEAVAIYDLIFQDPDSSTRKADAYYRARKSKLIEELEKRFHPFLKIEEGSRSEIRFQLDPESNRFSALVAEYLARFTPWDTVCELPRKLDGWSTITSLQSSQASQIHALVHPACFARICEALKLAPPEKSLALPKFFVEAPTPPNQPGASQLTDDEITKVRRTLRDDREKRKRFKPESLRVVVDGVEAASLILRGQQKNIQIDLPAGATLLEVFGREGNHELLLASHVVMEDNGDASSRPPELYASVLEGGHRISLTIRPDGRVVEIVYAQQAHASRWWQFSNFLRATDPRDLRGRSRISAPALAIILIAAIGLGVAIFITVTRRSNDEFARVEPTPQIQAPSFEQSSPSPQSIASVSTPAPSPKASPTAERTREQATSAIKSLAEMRNVYVMPFGSDLFSQTVHDAVAEKLRERFSVTAGPGEADTAVSASVSGIGAPRMPGDDEVAVVQLRLLNAAGETIWRTKRYRGTASAIADQFWRDLQAALERDQNREKRE